MQSEEAGGYFYIFAKKDGSTSKSFGRTGAGLGVSHQTGWIGLVAVLIDLFGRVDAHGLLETEREKFAARLVREQVGGEQAGKN